MYKSIQLILGGIAVILLSGCQSTAKLGLYRFDQGDYWRAVPDLQDAADKGNPEAAVDLGYLAQYGLSVHQNEKAAEQLYQRAMSHGSVRAETCLAVLYMQGRYVPHDYEKAIQLLKDADVRGDPFATDDLAYIYIVGLGVPVDKVVGQQYASKTGRAAGDEDISRYVNAMRWYVEGNRKFPVDAVKAGHFGKNMVEFDIVDNHAENIRITQSSGFNDLDNASIEAVASTGFPPPPVGLIQVRHFSIGFNYSH